MRVMSAIALQSGFRNASREMSSLNKRCWSTKASNSDVRGTTKRSTFYEQPQLLGLRSRCRSTVQVFLNQRYANEKCKSPKYLGDAQRPRQGDQLKHRRYIKSSLKWSCCLVGFDARSEFGGQAEETAWRDGVNRW